MVYYYYYFLVESQLKLLGGCNSAGRMEGVRNVFKVSELKNNVKERRTCVHFQQNSGLMLFMQYSFTTFRERGKTGYDGEEALVPLSVRPQLSATTTPTTLTVEEMGGGK